MRKTTKIYKKLRVNKITKKDKFVKLHKTML